MLFRSLCKRTLTIPKACCRLIKPRSLISSDDEYSLFAVVVFKRVHDDFIQKCRENKYAQLYSRRHRVQSKLIVTSRYIVREFTFSEEAIDKQREELEAADTTEKELWVSGAYA